MESAEYKLCLSCAAEFELERCGGGCPVLKRRKSKSKKRYDDRFHRCPLCGGSLIETTEEAEWQYAGRQQREMPRLEASARAKGESVAGILQRALK